MKKTILNLVLAAFSAGLAMVSLSSCGGDDRFCECTYFKDPKNETSHFWIHIGPNDYVLFQDFFCSDLEVSLEKRYHDTEGIFVWGNENVKPFPYYKNATVKCHADVSSGDK